jgi:hypothetical protein
MAGCLAIGSVVEYSEDGGKTWIHILDYVGCDPFSLVMSDEFREAYKHVQVRTLWG